MSLALDGTDDVVNIASVAVPQSAGSVSLWWRPDENVSDSAGVLHSLFQVTTASPLQIFECFVYSDGVMYSGWYRSAVGDRRHTWTVTGITTGVWYHLVLTWDATSSKLWINNTEIASINGTTAAAGWDTSSETFKIGYNSTSTSYAYMGVTDFRVYDRVLSASERTTLYESRLRHCVLNGIKYYFPCDDGEAGTSADGDNVRDVVGGLAGVPDDGAGNTGMSWEGETFLSYPAT